MSATMWVADSVSIQVLPVGSSLAKTAFGWLPPVEICVTFSAR